MLWFSTQCQFVVQGRFLLFVLFLLVALLYACCDDDLSTLLLIRCGESNVLGSGTSGFSCPAPCPPATGLNNHLDARGGHHRARGSLGGAQPGPFGIWWRQRHRAAFRDYCPLAIPLEI